MVWRVQDGVIHRQEALVVAGEAQLHRKGMEPEVHGLLETMLVRRNI